MTAALSNGGGLSFGVALSDPPLMRSGAPGVLTSQPTHQRPRLGQSDLTAFLYQRERGYCIGMISSRWCAKGANVCGAGGL